MTLLFRFHSILHFSPIPNTKKTSFYKQNLSILPSRSTAIQSSIQSHIRMCFLKLYQSPPWQVKGTTMFNSLYWILNYIHSCRSTWPGTDYNYVESLFKTVNNLCPQVCFMCPPTPGPPWWWDGHCYYEYRQDKPNYPCASEPMKPPPCPAPEKTCSPCPPGCPK